MATELEDHNEGQRDGAKATFLGSLAVEWNPFLSTAYKQGFRHGLQHQPERQVPEEPRIHKPSEAADDDKEEMPWFLKLIFAFYLLIFSGVFLFLRWTIQRPWRVAVLLLLAGIIALIVRQGQPLPNAQIETPVAASQPVTSDTLSIAEQPVAPAAAAAAITTPMANGGSSFTFLGEFSNEEERDAHFDPHAEPRPPYRVELWMDEATGVVGHVFYPVLEADSPVSRIQSATFDEISGAITFQARIWVGNSYPENEPQYQIHVFTGVLKDGTLEGGFSRQDEERRFAAVQEAVTLKQVASRDQWESITTRAQWEAEYSSLVMSRWN